REQEPGVLRCDFVVPDLAGLGGRVVDPHGEPLPGCCVYAVEEASARFSYPAFTRADGRFELRNLVGETFRVLAHAPDGDPQHAVVECLGVRAGAAPLELCVADTAMPRGTV